MLHNSSQLTIIIMQERGWGLTVHSKAQAKKKPDVHRAFQKNNVD
jgi:hypothetical protein